MDRQAASQPASQPASRPQLSAERRAELEAWIGQLGDASFDTREKATEALKQAPEAIPLLADTYRRTKDAEVIERIEQIARSLFFDHISKANQPGFLGIEPLLVRQIDVPQLPDKVAGVQIASIVEDAPAQKAGLQEGDVIVRFAGKTMPEDAMIADFTERVMAQGAGKRVEVEILRDGKPMKFTVTLANRERFAPDLSDEEEAQRRFEAWWQKTFPKPE